jgi:hypothetical protein
MPPCLLFENGVLGLGFGFWFTVWLVKLYLVLGLGFGFFFGL